MEVHFSAELEKKQRFGRKGAGTDEPTAATVSL